jgi:hypothetical protein
MPNGFVISFTAMSRRIAHKRADAQSLVSTLIEASASRVWREKAITPNEMRVRGLAISNEEQSDV